MATVVTLPPGATKANLLRGDYSLRYWDEMTMVTGGAAAARRTPPGATVLTVTTGTVSPTLALGERAVLWFTDAGDVVVAVKLIVGGKRYTTSSSPGWTDPEPGSIRSRPSTYAPPGTGVADPAPI